MAYSVNEALDKKDQLENQLIEVHGILSFEFECHAISHFPRSDQRQSSQEGHTYPSGIWLYAGTGSIQLDAEVLQRWSGKRVSVTGILYGPGPIGGCGHFSAYPAELIVQSIELL